MNKKRVLIIGHGNIGRALHERLLEEKSYDVVGVATSKGFFRGTPDALTCTSDVSIYRVFKGDLAFLAIPTLDDGSIAWQYMMSFLERGIAVVTCEKGALANHFEVLQSSLDRIGYSATVGGGSGIIDFVRSRLTSRTQGVHVILNGTLNSIWSDMENEIPFDLAVSFARKNGYADPGEEDPIRVVMQEARSDATKKAAILYNLCFNPRSALRASDFSVELTEKMIRDAIQNLDMRFVVSFEPTQRAHDQERAIWAFSHVGPEWTIRGGFVPLFCSQISKLRRTGPDNGALMVEGEDGKDGAYLCAGPGAGAGPTTSAMLRDAERLLA